MKDLIYFPRRFFWRWLSGFWLLVFLLVPAVPAAASVALLGDATAFGYPGESGSGYLAEAEKDALVLVAAPAPVTHQVRAGDTVWRIAQTYGVTQTALVQLNALADPTLIHCGQVLNIPGGAGSEARAATVSRGTAPAAAKTVFAWPLQGRLTSAFGPRNNAFHHGIDLAATTGTPIRAAREGTVATSQWLGDYGRAVIIAHAEGTRTLYGHASKLLVKKGEKVKAGQIIAQVGSTGRSTGPHLHFEILINGKPQNPLAYLP